MIDLEVIELDLNVVDLYGWEIKKSDVVIDSIIRGIEQGDHFSSVPVIKISDKVYCLAMTSILVSNITVVDGGHHRAVGHYIANQPLRVVVIGYANKIDNGFFLIGKTLLIDDDKMPPDRRYDFRKSVFRDYR